MTSFIHKWHCPILFLGYLQGFPVRNWVVLWGRKNSNGNHQSKAMQVDEYLIVCVGILLIYSLCLEKVRFSAFLFTQTQKFVFDEILHQCRERST